MKICDLFCSDELCERRFRVLHANTVVQVTSETDSENEFVEKKTKKKKDALPAGQKKLVFESGAKRESTSNRGLFCSHCSVLYDSEDIHLEKKSSEKLQRVTAAEFFEDNDVVGRSTSTQQKVSYSEIR